MEFLLGTADPGATALLAENRTPVTFARLREHVETTTERLRSLGFRPADRAALVLPNGPDLATAFLSVAACAGAAPLNPAYKAEELEFHLRSAKARAILVERGSPSPAIGVARTLGLQVVEITPTAEAGVFSLKGEPLEARGPAAEPEPEDVALLLHTSGTTARPKLVPISHANLRAGTENFLRMTPLEPDDRSLSFMPLFHVGGLLTCYFVGLAAGGSVVCLPGLDSSRFPRWLEEYSPTWFSAVPGMLQALLDRHGGDLSVLRSPRLRLIRAISSPCAPELHLRAEAAFGAPVSESYGLTESTMSAACIQIAPRRWKPRSIGTARGSTEAAIMDPGGRLLPAGETGEIVLRGPSIIRGYEDNPDANRAAFVNGWFRTGDQGSMDAEGFLFLGGRLKELIDRGGEKISPLEVEEVLLAHPAVHRAAVFPIAHPTLGQEVAAAVVLRNGGLEEAALRSFAAARLADFKVPRRILFLPEIPTGPTGKVQRLKLGEVLGLNAGRARFDEPRSPLEIELSKIWSRILRVSRVGLGDDFFQLGGDSMSAAELIEAIRSATGVEFPRIRLMQNSTLAGQAAAIAQLQGAARVEESEIDRMVRELEEGRPEA